MCYYTYVPLLQILRRTQDKYRTNQRVGRIPQQLPPCSGWSETWRSPAGPGRRAPGCRRQHCHRRRRRRCRHVGGGVYDEQESSNLNSCCIFVQPESWFPHLTNTHLGCQQIHIWDVNKYTLEVPTNTHLRCQQIHICICIQMLIHITSCLQSDIWISLCLPINI